MYKTIKDKNQISDLFNNGTFWHSRNFFIIYKSSEDQEVAYIAGKKLGKAHIRNFAKRRLRHLYFENQDLFEQKSALLVAKKGTLSADFYSLSKEIKRFKTTS